MAVTQRKAQLNFIFKNKGWLFCKMDCLPYDCMAGALFYEMLTLLLHFIK
jgi:hypothetical protein